MPIPRPEANEEQEHYIGRCMHAIGNEYENNHQAVAVCFSTWREHHKNMNLSQQILEQARNNPANKGIFPASRYLSDMVACQNGGACPSQMWQLASVSDWDNTLKQSTEKLTATDPEWGFDDKSFSSAPGFIMVASGIMSTTKMDSDRDILEAKGAELESVCPYLWHHMPSVPVGKVLSHTISTVKNAEGERDAVLFKCGILDVGNGLGRDTALLIEMGAMRNSHGFEALEASPIKGAGWHVKKYKTFEISAVTIPANNDAVFTEYSKEKSRFTSDQVRSWIKGHYDERQKLWKGFSVEDLDSGKKMTITADLVLNTDKAEEAVAALEEKIQKLNGSNTCTCKEKQPAADEITVKKSEWEELKQKLADFELKETPSVNTELVTKPEKSRVVDPVLASLGL